MSTIEAEPELDPRGNSPADQGSPIPLGWKPTPAEPVPVVRCTQIKADGDRCNNWSLRGYHKCFVHSGRGGLKNVTKYAEAVVESARLRLIDESDGAVTQLVTLMQPGTAEQIRLKAATEILDRAGIRGGFEIDTTIEVTDNPADLIRKRLHELKEGAEAAQKIRDGYDVVDGEIIEDQPALFDLEATDDGE
jgi:hypothetical protein